MEGVSASWTTPDPRRTGPGPVFGVPPADPRPDRPSVADDARAMALTVAVSVLLGAPVGLLWAAIAPRVPVVVAGGDVNLAETYGDGFIAVDGYFFAAVVLSGLVGGLVAWWLGHLHGPAVVVGLALGGLAAAWVAMRVGEQVGLDALRAAVAAGEQGRFDLSLDLKSTAALVGWPVTSLLAYLGASATTGR